MNYLIKRVKIGQTVGATVNNCCTSIEEAHERAAELDKEMQENSECEFRGGNPEYHHIVTDQNGYVF